MTHLGLTQAEADALIALAKRRVDDRVWDCPGPGERIEIPLVSEDRREHFFLDLRRSRIDFSKGTYQNRARQIVVLVRLDFGSAPHRNPDGEEVGSPHLHVYREGFGDRWAFAPPAGRFSMPTDRWQALQDFMRYCNVVQPPDFRRSLFA